ncbi:Holliday junction resolvase RuvX [Candidatus Atelocyanobacterium thalassae]|uniref:Putative pre-16S rRNA nuclease n=1 Tax=cyanobacterium endosymbiont of Braarudosphaera bigelowii TaxID=1285375 RepID=A0ABM7U5G1_9CHRO|nr:Holliday junction resolvase RuvX [Candidatus Atelocyanobacterium thalassa]BDA39965.1 putative pre-16S rRNA nuclease [cyanobacterium endosymbiont of Braarudosphaera bigelowii]
MTEKICVLGLDVGNKRIGVAGCDGTGLIATELITIHRQSFLSDIEQIKKIIKEREVTKLIIGLPILADGNLGSQAKQIQKFGNRISTVLNLAIEYIDERFSSLEAESELKAQRKYSSYNKGLIDSYAAKIILQRWLDQRHITF